MSNRISTELENEELRGFARSMAELQWLLLVLVMLYFYIPTGPIPDPDSIIWTMVGYAGFILLFRYSGFQARETRLKLAVETWAMIAFITSILSHTGYIESPLLNLYLLVIIACAITLGRLMTLLEVILIASCYLYLGYRVYSMDILAAETFTVLMARFTPFLLVAYVTSLLASDVISARKKVMRLSQTDELTGLLNLRAFNLLLEKELARVSRSRQTFAILMVDVDNLKQINDSFGHSAGSRLLQAVAHTIGNCVRNADVVARYGGDEFVILMSDTGPEQARLCAERIRNAVRNSPLDIKGQRLSTTTSIGIASFPDSVAEAEKVLDKADLALYRSKQNGRNRVTWYDSAQAALSACA
jgi:diguanylate cyclase (GGDEF)-like protein